MDVDIRKFFDTIDHGHLRGFLKRRIRDGVLLRLIGKWLNAGVLEDGCISAPRDGSPPGRCGHPSHNLAIRPHLGAPVKRERADLYSIRIASVPTSTFLISDR